MRLTSRVIHMTRMGPNTEKLWYAAASVAVRPSQSGSNCRDSWHVFYRGSVYKGHREYEHLLCWKLSCEGLEI